MICPQRNRYLICLVWKQTYFLHLPWFSTIPSSSELTNALFTAMPSHITLYLNNELILQPKWDNGECLLDSQIFPCAPLSRRCYYYYYQCYYYYYYRIVGIYWRLSMTLFKGPYLRSLTFFRIEHNTPSETASSMWCTFPHRHTWVCNSRYRSKSGLAIITNYLFEWCLFPSPMCASMAWRYYYPRDGQFH